MGSYASDIAQRTAGAATGVDRVFTVGGAQAVAALGSDPNVIWCTGPSKTADVEGILIEGVHGPGAQIALIVD